MFGSWRFKLREAEEAFKNGRPDVAAALIRDADLQRWRRPLYGPAARGDRLVGRVSGRNDCAILERGVSRYPGTVVTAKIPAMTLIEPD